MDELQNLGLIEAARVDNTKVAMPEPINPLMSLTPKSSENQSFGSSLPAGSTYGASYGAPY